MVREQSIESFYSRLKESVRESPSSPLFVFPSTSDVDSLCASKIICHVLESDCIRYGCYPVSSFKEIHNTIEKKKNPSSDNPSFTALLINWGCHRDLRRELNFPSSASVFVVDSHRPIHLQNLSDRNPRVIVLYTKDDEQQADLAYDFDVSALANASDLNSDDDEVDSDSDGSDDDDDDDDDDDGRRKRQRISAENESNPVKLYKKLKREYYYMGTFHGKPSGCLMYDLSHSLRKNDNELLWLACVALTDQLVHERLTDERYQSAAMELEQHINSSKFNIPGGCSRIAYEDAPKLMLLQEWNLYDSLMCSSYVATKLKTWSGNGLKRMNFLLGRMGFPKAECRQKFPFMSVEIKRRMKEMFRQFFPEFGLTDFYYRGFTLSDGYGSKLCAADVVYGASALLESSSGSNQFSTASDALSAAHSEKLETGMRQAIEVQRAIIGQGGSAVTRKGSIRSGGKFRWLKVDDTGADSKLLCHPQALTKFGCFVMEALKEKGARMKPLMCACHVEGKVKGKMLIVGVCGKPRIGAVKGNAFGIAFRAAAEETGAEYFHEMFESSWIVLDSGVVNSFVVRLNQILV
ncbi:hypothetical protein M569_11849 [Genlisea aurea]|uniref:Uncharacterized protein n=1 Tax=Genlisea aurea TaxID=192259 RepID=S8C7Y8_9LAMI|nr:hypothetical protein M569_11849 [Genlisea aurea]